MFKKYHGKDGPMTVYTTASSPAGDLLFGRRAVRDRPAVDRCFFCWQEHSA